MMKVSDPRRILFISHTSRHGGAEHVLLSLLSGLDRSLFEPLVVFPLEGSLKQAVDALGIKTFISPLEWWIRDRSYPGLPGSSLTKRVRLLQAIIEQERIDLVHTNTSVIWEGALAAKFAGRPHVWHLHERLLAHPDLKPVLPLQQVFNVMGILSDQIVTVSQWVADQFPVENDNGKVRVINNGIDIAHMKGGTPGNFRKGLGLSSDLLLFVVIGTIAKGKGIGTLLGALQSSRDRFPANQFRFVIVGGGESLAIAALRHEIASLGDIVTYVGERHDIPDVLADCDVLILPSKAEAFPLVLLEAMAAGKPVIATRCGGPTEIVEAGVTGLLVPVEDSATLARAIIELAGNRDMLRTMGLRAAAVVAERWDVATFVDNCSAVYGEILSDHLNAEMSQEEKSAIDGYITAYGPLSRVYFRKAILYCISSVTGSMLSKAFQAVRNRVSKFLGTGH